VIQAAVIIPICCPFIAQAIISQNTAEIPHNFAWDALVVGKGIWRCKGGWGWPKVLLPLRRYAVGCMVNWRDIHGEELGYVLDRRD